MMANRLDANLLRELYVEKELSLVDIQNQTGRSKSSVHRDLIFWGIPRRSYKESYAIRDAKKKCWHNDVDLTMRPPLAYILGVIYGDGYVQRRGGKERGKCIITLGVSSETFAQEFASKVREVGLHCVVKKYNWTMPRARNWKPSYRATFWCAKFYYWFKSLTYEKVENLLQENNVIKAFIKGFYEAEGCCYRGRGRVVVSMANCDRELLELVSKLLYKVGFQFRLYGPYYPKNPKWSSHFRLELGIREEVEQFLSIIKPCIKI